MFNNQTIVLTNCANCAKFVLIVLCNCAKFVLIVLCNCAKFVLIVLDRIMLYQSSNVKQE